MKRSGLEWIGVDQSGAEWSEGKWRETRRDRIEQSYQGGEDRGVTRRVDHIEKIILDQ